MRKIALILLLLALNQKGYSQYDRVSFYVVAHPDQWQLFMGLNASDDLSTPDDAIKSKVVFIYTTAGDQSCNGSPCNTPHYLARQEAAHTAIEFCSDRTRDHGQWHTSHDVVNGHTILKYNYNNAVSYCLRLPDGCNGNSLFKESLQSLHSGNSSISAIDSSATYHDWNDLITTVQQIMTNERSNIGDMYVNTADTDAVLNKGDDPDHIYTGLLCLNALDSMHHLTINLFREAIIASLPANTDDIAIAAKAALLSQMDYVRTENGMPSEWTPQNISYLSRNYLRTVTR